MRVADCDEDHSISVLSSVQADPYTPSDLYMTEVEHLYETVPVKMKKWWFPFCG